MGLINKLTTIANKIRTLDGTTSEYTLDEMAESVDDANTEITTQAQKIAQISAILDSKKAVTPVIMPLEITKNGTYVVPEGVDGYSPIVVNVDELPPGFTELNYIQSHGGQWIDTGVLPSGTDFRVVLEFTLTEELSGSLYGSSSGSHWSLIPYTGITFYVGKSERVGSISVSSNVRHTLDCHAYNGTLTVTLDEITSTYSYTGPVYTGRTLMLFAQNDYTNNTVAIQNPSKYRSHRAKIYNNGILVRDYKPCINVSGEYGLFDMAYYQLYTNAGTGSFTGG